MLSNILTATNDYILQYCKPVIEQDKVFKGYQNRTAPPPVNDYIVFAINSTQRVGTNILDFNNSSDTLLGNKSLRQYKIDIDITHDDNNIAFNRAATFETLGRSAVSVDFFKTYGVSFLYAEDIKFLPYVDDSKQYIYRYRVSINISVWSLIKTPQEFFYKAVLENLEDVDEHHKP